MSTSYSTLKHRFGILAAATSVALLLPALGNAQPARPTTGAPAGGTPATSAAAPASGSAATGTPAGTDPATTQQKSLTEILIGNAVPKGADGKSTADTPQYQDVTNAIIRFKNGDLKNAEDLLRDARHKSQNKLPPVEVMLAKLFAIAGQAGPARQQLEKAVVAEPKDPEPYLLFAEAALQDRRITDAVALLNMASQTAKDYNENATRKRDFEIRTNAAKAVAMIAREQWPTAETYLAEWIKIDPDNANAHQQMGRVLFQEGKPNDARNEFAAAVKADKNAANPDILMAQLYEEQKKREDARSSIEKAIKSNPNDANVFLAAANWAMATNQMPAAQKYADQALGLKSSVEAKIMRGKIARLSNDLKTAEKYLQEASMEQPGNVDASNQLALVLIDQDDSEKKNRAEQIAANNLKITTDGNRFSPEVFTTAAWVQYRMGRTDQAQQLIGRVLQTGQVSQDGLYYLARILQDANKMDDAVKLLQAAIDAPAPFAQRDKAAELLRDLQAKQKQQAENTKGGDSSKNK